MKSFFIFSFVLVIGSLSLFSQTPTVQDCEGAIPLCFSTYSTTNSYVGAGNYPNEIPTHSPISDNMCPGNCLLSGELNDVWYTFTVQTSGTVTFNINPNSAGDDYDWAVYNLTNANCASIYTNPALQTSCNFCGTVGATGPTGGSTNTCQPGNTCTNFNAALNVTSGQTYVVNVSNFSSTQSGYSITFGGTAQVVDNTGPYLYNVQVSPSCGQNQVTIRFSENVLCSTVQNTDFTISGPGGPYSVTAVSGPVCTLGGTYERDYTLTVSPAFTSGGTYTIGLVSNSVSDLCSHPTGGQTLNFTVTGVSASASVVSNVNCNGQSNGSATATGSGGTAPYTYQWSNGQTSATATGLAAATYTVTVRDNLGICNATASVTITQPTLLTSSVSKTNVSCNGGNNGTASVSASGGSPGYSYNWSTGQTTASISGLTAGTYNVTVTDTHGCTSAGSAVITQPTALTTSISSSTNVSCNGGNNGSATVSASGGTPAYTYSWSNGATTATTSGLTAGTYTVTVRDANNCSSTKTVTITQPTALTSSISASTQVSCNGGNNGTATVTQSGGTSPYTYSWSNGQTTVTATGLVAGTYTVTVRDVNLCTSVSTVNITQPTAVSATLTKTNVSCNGGNNGTATATPSGGTPGYTYTWSNGQTTQTATGLSAVAYSVTVRDANNCSTVQSITITQPITLTSSISSSTNVACNGGSNGSATAAGSGGTPAYTYSWSNGQNVATATNLSSGTYTVTVRDANNCSSTSSVNITQPTSLTVSTSTVSVLCNGGSTGTATASPSGGTPGYTYTWSNAQTTATATGLIAGTYSVTVRDVNNCSTTASVTVTQPTLLSTSTSQTNVSCNGGNNGSATVSASGGTPSYTYLWSNSQTGATATGLVSGTYSVTVRDANNCSSTQSVTITQPTALSATASATNTSCFSGSNGTATATPSGGTGPYTYSWFPGGQTTATATGLSAGSYSVTVTDNRGCTVVRTANVSQPAAIVLTTSKTDATCGNTNGSATVSASGGTPSYTYSWSNGGSTSTISSIAAGSYTVTVRDVNNCSSTATVAVNNSGAPTVSISSYTTVTCNGGTNGSATVSASGGTPGYTYLWSNGATGVSISNVVANNYSVTITDAIGCQATTSINITQPTAVNASITGNISPLCFGANNGSATVSASGGIPPTYTYLWSNSQTTATALNLTAGVYTVTVRDVNNCSATSSVTVTQPTQVTATMSSATQVSCNGGSNGAATVSPAGGTPGYTYLWSQGTTTASVTNLSAGTYSVTVRDVNNCSATSSVTITQPTALSSTVSSTGVSCNSGNNGTATATPSGGTPGYTYLWSNSQTLATATNLVSGTYTVTITDTRGCTNTNSVTVTQPTLLTSSISVSTNVSCNGGSTGSATVTGSGGTPSYTYLWSNSQTTATATGLAAGTYSVTVRDANNCTSASSVTITQPTVLTSSITTSTNVSCNGGNNGSATASPTGGTPSYTYLWSNGQTTSTATSLIAGTYTVTIRDVNNCSSNTSVTITQPTVLSSSISASTQVSCNGGNNGSATVNPSGGTPTYTYIWSNGQTTVSATTLVAGTYTVTVTDSKGCTTTSSVTITQPTQLTTSISSSTQVSCNGGSNGTATVAPAGGTPAYTYLWSNGQTLATATGLSSGTYSVTVSDNKGCTSTSSVTITQPTILTSSISASSQVLCFGGSSGTATVTQSGGTPSYTYLWSNGQTTSTATGLAIGTYTVTVRDVNNCTSTSSVTITQPAQLTSSISSSSNISCNGASDGSATVNPSGGTSPYTYFWSTGQAVTTATGLTAGSYTVTVTDSKGCTSTSAVTITQPAVLTSTTSVVNPTCNGGYNGTATANPSGGTSPFTYSWFPTSQTTQTATGLGAGTYQLTITDSHSCTFLTSATVGEPSALSITPSSVNATCGNSNGSASVSISGGTSPYSYLWSTGGTNSSISSVPAGSYSVTVTDAQLCTNTTTISLNNSGAPTISLVSSSNVSCNGGSNGSAEIVVSGGTPGYTYLWSNGDTDTLITNVAANVYSVTVTDNINCQATYNVTITQPTALIASITGTVNTSCYGLADGVASANASGGTPNYFFTWSNGGTTPSVNGLAAGSYIVTVTDSRGCTTTTTATISQPVQVSAIISAFTNVTCNGGSDGSATVSASGGTPGYTYLWSNGSSTTTASGLQAGNYIVTVTDSQNCTAQTSTTINQTAALQVNIPMVSNVSCFGGSTGQANATVSGGSSPYGYLWSNGTATALNSNLIAGIYTVTVTDANLCTGTNSVTITEPALLTATATAITNVSCNGGNNGSASASGSGGTPAYWYHWSNNGSFQNTSGLGAGVHSVTITDINGCTAVATVTITEPALLSLNFVSDSAQCNNTPTANIDMTVNGGTSPYNYLWNNSSTTEDLTNVNAGTYTVTVSDVNFCSSVQTVSVYQPIALSATFTPVDAHCNQNDGSITINPAGGTPSYSFAWDANAGSQVSQTAINLIAGSYDITVTDANSCTAVFTGAVSNLNAATLQFDQIVNNICYGDSSGFVHANIVSGGTPPFNFVWSTGGTTDSIFNLFAGDYILTLTDGTGCITIDTATVSEPQMVQVTIDSIISISCFGLNNGGLIVSISGGTPAYSYSWQDFSGNTISTTNSIANVSAGVYYLTVTDINSCTQTFNGTINQPVQLLTSMLEPVSPKCSYSSDGMAVVLISGGSAPYNILWDDALATADDTVSTLSGPADYHVTVTDNNGCTTTDTVHIDAPLPVVITSYVFPAICSASNGWAYVEVAGGTPNYTFIWSTGSSNDTILNQPSGIYTVTVYDASACMSVDTLDINNVGAGSIQVDVLTNVSCYGDSTGAITISLSGGTAPYTYQWSIPGNSPSQTNLLSGIYSVSVTDMNNCQADTVLTVTQPSAPLASNFTFNGITCFGSNNGSSSVNPNGGTGPYNILWFNGDTLTSVSGLSPDTIAVTITDANGCVVTGSAVLNEPAALIATVQNYVNPTCGNTGDGSITTSVTGGTSPYSFHWLGNDTTSDLTGLAAGSYSLTVTDSNLCSDSLTQTLESSSTIIDSITHDIGTDNLGWANISVAGGTPNYAYLWSNGATTANISGLVPGIYYVTITDANTCFIIDSVTIDIPLIIPSVITPNADHVNDNFEIVGIGGYPEVSIEIYNRWGDLIYVFSGTGMEYTDVSKRWNGQYQGKDLPMGSYVYIIRLGENIDPYTGVVSIIR